MVQYRVTYNIPANIVLNQRYFNFHDILLFLPLIKYSLISYMALDMNLFFIRCAIISMSKKQNTSRGFVNEKNMKIMDVGG